MRSHRSKSRWQPLGGVAAPLVLLLAVETTPERVAAMPAAVRAGIAPSVVLAKVAASNRINGLTVEELNDGSTILRFSGSAEPTFNVYRLSAPERLVVDIAGSERGKVVPHAPLDTWACGRVAVDSVKERGAKLTRIVIDLKREVSYIVVPDGNKLVVTLTPREVPPEAYFARKSAGKRRAEIEKQTRQAKKMHRDASALKQEAKALNDEAARRAKNAAVRAEEAGKQAEQARQAFARAKAAAAKANEAEAASRKAEAAARQALADAKNDRAKARDDRASAKAARERARDAVAKAEMERKAAQKERQAAEKRAREAVAKAEMERSAAQKEREAAEAERERLERAHKAAKRALAKARTEAKEERGKAREASLRAAAAEAEAHRDRLSAKQIREHAEKARMEAEDALARAADAMDRAEQERRDAARARAQAEQELAAARREASKSRNSAGKSKANAMRAVAAAEDARRRAKDRQQSAERTLEKLSADRDLLQRKLAAQRKRNEDLDRTIAARAKELEDLEHKVRAAKAKVRTAEAKARTATTKAQDATAEAQNATDRARAARARERAAKANAKRKALERARSDAKLAAARERKVENLKRTLMTARVDAKRAEMRVQELERDRAGRAKLKPARQQARATRKKVRALENALKADERRLARSMRKLERSDAPAESELVFAEERLAHVRESLQRETAKLTKVQDDVGKAQSKLDKRLAELAARREASKAPEPKPEVAQAAAPPPEKPQKKTKKKKARRKAENKEKKVYAKVRDIRFEDSPEEERVIVDVEGPLFFAGHSLTPRMQMLELRNAKVPHQLERSLDATSYDGPVAMVTSFAEGEDAKIIVATQDGTKPRIEEQPGKLVWHFPRDKARARSKPKSGSKAGSNVVSMAGSKVGGVAQVPKPAATTAAAAAAAPPPPSGRSRGKWRGERIDIELQEAPIKDVLLLFSDIGRVNIIAGRGVGGTVTMKLTAVPWDQALDIILRSLNLGMVREGNVIRVATVEDLEAERRKAIERAAAQVQLKPLETRLVPISYAVAQDMLPKVQSVLSSRGSVTPDTRTNTLIIMDVAENIALAEQLINQLDSQTPQVLIEARIVEARTNFLRQLGIQWGFGYIASPGTGNATGLLFPNSLAAGGGASGQPPDTRGLLLPGAAASPNYAVDLPAPVGTGAGGALGFSFGSIDGNLNTNLRLSAAEDVGEVRIISAPKIVTLDNTEARIEQGVQIPVSQVSAQGVNTRYVNATLALAVTPHVTNEGAVLLEVEVQKNEADFINTGARGDPTILTKQASSRLLVQDGDTAVIGGIYTRNKSLNYKKVPWIADIPIIGWFFKNKAEADTRTEVLIFLTPKIVNRASSIGG